MLNRKDFIRKALWGAGAVLAGNMPYAAAARIRERRLTVLHTNDLHSRLEPFPENSGSLSGLGGAAARAALIREIREKEPHVLLVDAGDIFQGTPYFNLYHGEPEIKLMSRMGYDAVTMGNHDFDAGVEGFARQLAHATFPVVISNYDFTGTALEGKTIPYFIVRKGGMKIGLLGLGIELEGLVAPAMYGATKYLDPVMTGRRVSAYLKKERQCDLVICLSHLGYAYASSRISDVVLAGETEYIDLIIGGHTHTFLERPEVVRNRLGKEVLIHQVGWAGVRLGRLDFRLDSKNSSRLVGVQSVIVGKQTIG